MDYVEALLRRLSCECSLRLGREAVRIAVDWDDTLVDGQSQEWLPDAEWALGRMVKAGWQVSVLSCRSVVAGGSGFD